jgi:hypothetical protein
MAVIVGLLALGGAILLGVGVATLACSPTDWDHR